MDFALPPDDDPRRVAVRRWLAEHPSPDGRSLAAAGLVAPHWPEQWGLGANPETSSSSTKSWLGPPPTSW